MATENDRTSGDVTSGRQFARELWWLAVVVVGVVAGQLMFHLVTGLRPRGAAVLPIWTEIPIGIVALIAATRERGRLRVGFGGFAMSQFLPLFGLGQSGGWWAWSIRNAIVSVSCAFLLAADFPHWQGRWWKAVAIFVVATTFSYGTQRFGYDLWREANGLKSVMSP